MTRSFLMLAFALLLAAAAPAPVKADWRASLGDASGLDGSISIGRTERSDSRSARRSRDDVAVASLGDDDDAPVARRRDRRSGKARGPQSLSTPRGAVHGIASYYWQPQRVASGGRFNPNALTAAHRTLPFGTRVRVTHGGNGRSVTVTINDRGPFVRGRIIDLSRAAAGVIGMRGSGVAGVRLEVLGR
jgi:rare lipoprotein A